MSLPTNDGTTSSDAATRAASRWLEYMANRPCVFIHHPSHAIRPDPQASGYDAYCQRQDWQEAMERVTPPANCNLCGRPVSASEGDNHQACEDEESARADDYLSEGHSAHYLAAENRDAF